MIAWPSTSMRWVTGSSMERGSSPLILATASLTSLSARSVSRPIWNSMTVCDEPSFTDETMCLTPVIEDTASSTRFVTWLSSSARRGARLRDRNSDHRHVDVREPRHGHVQKREHTERAEHHEEHERRDRLADGPGGDIHGLLTRGFGELLRRLHLVAVAQERAGACSTTTSSLARPPKTSARSPSM